MFYSAGTLKFNVVTFKLCLVLGLVHFYPLIAVLVTLIERQGSKQQHQKLETTNSTSQVSSVHVQNWYDH